jgi:hypothetical protein
MLQVFCFIGWGRESKFHFDFLLFNGCIAIYTR